MHGLTAGMGEHCRRTRVGELEELSDDNGGRDHARHRGRQVRGDASCHGRHVSSEETLNQTEKHETNQQRRRDVPHHRVRRTDAREPGRVDIRAVPRLARKFTTPSTKNATEPRTQLVIPCSDRAPRPARRRVDDFRDDIDRVGEVGDDE